MALTRRHFAKLCAGIGFSPISALASSSGVPAFLSAYRDPAGAFGVAALDDEGAILFTEALPARGHDTVVSPDHSTAVTFARRPGRFALVIDLTQQLPAFAFEASAGRHFYGHGFFSPDGRLLYATENDYRNERGVIGIYDVEAGYHRLAELDTRGIGPHEALLLRDGRTIAVANGGILTHPDFPRQKLNLSTMAPSLSYIDSLTGDLVEQVALPQAMNQLSIRHMDEAGDGSVWFGGQYEGAPTDEVALVGRHRLGSSIELVNPPEHVQSGLRHYVGSVKASGDGSHVAVTSPRGDTVLVFQTGDQALIDQINLSDVCGVAARHNAFALSTGDGLLTLGAELVHPLAWDNHLRSLAST